MSSEMDFLPPWLDLKLIEAALRQGYSDPTLEVINLSRNGLTGKGDNYGSQIFIVLVDLKINNENIQQRSYFLKTLGDSEMAQYILENGMWQREKTFFVNILPIINNFLHTHRPNQYPFTPLGFYYEHPSDHLKDLILLEDMRLDGFDIADRKIGLDLKQSLVVIEHLAKFHAISATITDQLLNHLRQVQGHLFFTENVSQIFQILIRSFNLELDDWPELKHLQKPIEHIADNIGPLGRSAFQHKPGEFLVLNHGDLWTPNLLFKNNSNSGEVERTLFIDFQLICYDSPAYDLQNFIYSSLQDEVRKNYTDVILEKYQRVLEETLTELNYSKPIPSLEEIQNEIKNKLILAFLISCSDFAISRSDPSDDFSFQHFLEPNYQIKRLKIFSKESIANELKRRLREFENKGFFENK